MSHRSFATHAVLGVVTERMWGGSFGDVHECAEHVMGHSIWTHEFASQPLWDEMRRRVLAAHPQPAGIDEADIPDSPGNAPERLARVVARFGATIDLPRGETRRDRSPLETLAEVAPGKPVVVVET